MTPPDAPRRLGRGLDALLAARAPKPRPGDTPADEPRDGDAHASVDAAPANAPTSRPTRATADGTDAATPERLAATVPAGTTTPAPADGTLVRLPLTRVRPSPFQPRRTFHDEELRELAASIDASGLLQPITVRPVGDIYELIAGERRFRAVTSLGWSDIPAVVRHFDDQLALSLALVENLQRSDLDPLEEAEGYQRLMQEFGATQTLVAEAVGKDRSTVANALRLLQLPAGVRRLVQERTLSAGHARALLALADERLMLDVARRAAAEGWSVREMERQVKRARPPKASAAKPGTKADNADAAAPNATRHIDDLLRRRFQTTARVNLSARDQGEVRIAFTSNDDLERILALMGITID